MNLKEILPKHQSLKVCMHYKLYFSFSVFLVLSYECSLVFGITDCLTSCLPCHRKKQKICKLFISTGFLDNLPFSGSSDKEEENDDDEEEEDEEDDDEELDEEELIKQMLAKEQQKLSQANNDGGGGDKNDDRNVHQVVSAATTDSEDFSSQSSSSSNVVTSIPAATASTEQTLSTSTTSTSTKSSSSQYPVSSTGHCPYCGSTDVKYIIVVSENTQDSELPQSLQQLLKSNQAFKMAKGEVHGSHNHAEA